MGQSNLPTTILLKRSDSVHYQNLKRVFRNWQIDILEVSVLAEIPEKIILDTVPIAMAVVDEENITGIDFLRSVMHANNWIQRIMLAPSMNIEVVERAVNKAHINYLLEIPVTVSKLETYLLKALRRYENITRPFAKFDALTSVTEELLIENEKFRMEATLDPLTKLMNRRSFNKILERVWQRYKEKDIVFSIALFDIDHFKNVNDTWGHSVGDQVLQKIAEIMLNNQRIGIDYAFRYGGEEFTILSSNTTGKEMKMYLERLLKIVSANGITYKGESITVTFSAGICEVNADESPETLINNSDAALYQAKNNGRNQVLLFSK